MTPIVSASADPAVPVNQVFYKSSAAMAEVPSSTVDSVVTSPPYFCVKNYSLDGHQNFVHSERMGTDFGAIEDYREYISALLDSWLECCRVLKPNPKSTNGKRACGRREVRSESDRQQGADPDGLVWALSVSAT